MPDLLASLLNQDLGHLRILAELWGLELDSHERDAAADELAASLLDPELARETLEVLPPEARAALDALLSANGRVEWSAFARKFGQIREMGAGKRDREQPHRKPVSAAEMLFYRGLLAKAFFDTEKGSQEFAYIPDDLMEIISHKNIGVETLHGNVSTLGRPATPVEKAHEIPATDRVLDDATTLLAALRVGNANFKFAPQLPALLHTAKLLKKNTPQAEAVKKFLEAPRPDALSMLVEAWKASATFDELRLLPGLVCEGEWTNSPRDTRHILLGFIQAIPQNQWWSVPAFLRDLKLKHPDFQRPAGDYDSWFIKRASDGQYLRGFAYWDAVDGALVRFIIQIMHWLGLADLAAPEEGKDFTAFRIPSPVSRPPSPESDKIAISSNGKISVARLAPRAVRYQIARFCEWDDDGGRVTAVGRVAAERRIETKPDAYAYHVSSRSLKSAQEQGLKTGQLLSLLAKHTSGNVPPALVKSLKRWEANGTEARAENQTVLRVSRPEVLEELRASKAARFLGEPLGPTAVIVKPGALSKVEAALAEMGLLLDSNEPPTI
jgi:hypothetical protein